jgi:hypothetical protein
LDAGWKPGDPGLPGADVLIENRQTSAKPNARGIRWVTGHMILGMARLRSCATPVQRANSYGTRSPDLMLYTTT